MLESHRLTEGTYRRVAVLCSERFPRRIETPPGGEEACDREVDEEEDKRALVVQSDAALDPRTATGHVCQLSLIPGRNLFGTHW